MKHALYIAICLLLVGCAGMPDKVCTYKILPNDTATIKCCRPATDIDKDFEGLELE